MADSNWDLAGVASTIATFASLVTGYFGYLTGGRYPVVIRPYYLPREHEGEMIARLTIEVESRTRNSILVTSVFYVTDRSNVGRTYAVSPHFFREMPTGGGGPDIPRDVPGHGIYTFVREATLEAVDHGMWAVVVANGRYFKKRVGMRLP